MRLIAAVALLALSCVRLEVVQMHRTAVVLAEFDVVQTHERVDLDVAHVDGLPHDLLMHLAGRGDLDFEVAADLCCTTEALATQNLEDSKRESVLTDNLQSSPTPATLVQNASESRPDLYSGCTCTRFLLFKNTDGKINVAAGSNADAAVPTAQSIRDDLEDFRLNLAS